MIGQFVTLRFLFSKGWYLWDRASRVCAHFTLMRNVSLKVFQRLQVGWSASVQDFYNFWGLPSGAHGPIFHMIKT